MNIRVGQKVAYPNHGVCKVESIEKTQSGATVEEYYALRVLANNSSILVPKSKVGKIGLRPVMKPVDCERLINFLAEDFKHPACDWKARGREFTAQFQTGDIFAVADVLKKLTFLAQSKPLSFREKRMFEKAKFLIVSELAVVCSQPECSVEEKVDAALTAACRKHRSSDAVKAASASVH